MDKLWLEQARAAHDVASGLSVYIEHSDRYATEIAAAMTDLLAISVLYRRLDDVDRPSEYGRSFYRISNDLDVVVTGFYGRDDPSMPHALSSGGFVLIVEMPFEREQSLRLYWRPTDCRTVINRAAGVVVHESEARCQPLRRRSEGTMATTTVNHAVVNDSLQDMVSIGDALEYPLLGNRWLRNLDTGILCSGWSFETHGTRVMSCVIVALKETWIV
ncbi:hypothetical protein M8818_007449 [Zalaria obscura]|uniref:Uncharacterized protein n=1 Tax=Zalaria obscura TaxID=2024903 RepID=A0ACC3S394_9PEZI